jgi:hypothetical protein
MRLLYELCNNGTSAKWEEAPIPTPLLLWASLFTPYTDTVHGCVVHFFFKTICVLVPSRCSGALANSSALSSLLTEELTDPLDTPARSDTDLQQVPSDKTSNALKTRLHPYCTALNSAVTHLVKRPIVKSVLEKKYRFTATKCSKPE